MRVARAIPPRLPALQTGPCSDGISSRHVFDYGLFTITTDLTPPTPALVVAVQSYWSNFARGGDPNTSLLTWPQYGTSSDQHMTPVNPPVIGTGLQSTACDFWDSYVASH